MDQVIYVTGFATYPGLERNPTAAIIEALDQTIVGPFTIHGEVLPTSFKHAPERVYQALKQKKPRIVLHFGVTLLDTVVRLESWAINEMSTASADDDDYQPYQEKIDPEEDLHATYETNVPVHDVVAGIRDLGYPARISRNAGRFVENCVYYQTMDYIAHRRKKIDGLFIHLPLPGLRPFGDLEEPAWDAERLTLATEAVLKAIAAVYMNA